VPNFISEGLYKDRNFRCPFVGGCDEAQLFLGRRAYLLIGRLFVFEIVHRSWVLRRKIVDAANDDQENYKFQGMLGKEYVGHVVAKNY